MSRSAAVAQHALWDCWIHERDIALPLGATPPVEPDEVGSGLRYAAALSAAFALTSGRGPDGAAGGGSTRVYAVETDETDETLSGFVLEVGESVDVRDGAAPPGAPCLRGDAVTLLEGLSLRVPLPASAPAEWLELLRGLATAFDVEVPSGR